MREMRWSEPVTARGCLLNFLDAQRPDGSLHGRLHTRHLEGTDFYHANWGDAVLALEATCPDREFLEAANEGLGRYARWLDATRDREQEGLYDVADQYETGQEYVSRYIAVDPDADRYDWESRIRLKGVDVTVYAYQLQRALETMAIRLGRMEEASAWRERASRTGRGILERMWDEGSGLFSDLDPRSGARTRVKAAACFYPLLTDLPGEREVARLLEHLQDPAEFATHYPVPSSSRDDPYFNANAEWKGKRHQRPWNGRVWPLANAHVLEGLLRQWHAGRREVGSYAAWLLARTVKMMFHDGDLARPNACEHYNPFTGQASVYRGVDDYMQGWILDQLIRGVAGLEPTLHGIRIDPLPLPLEEVDLDSATVCGRQVSVRRRGEEVLVVVDDTPYETRVGTPLEISFSEEPP
jgi:glycogen debranching enzyme